MKKISFYFILSLCWVSMACALPGNIINRFGSTLQAEPTSLQIGGTTVEQGEGVFAETNIWAYCMYIPEESNPASYAVNCTLPEMETVSVPFGWMAKDSMFDESWQAIQFRFRLDGQEIPLEKFAWKENTYPMEGENYRERVWYINLKNLSPAPHTISIAWSSSASVNDGFDVYQPGTYEHIINLNNNTPPEYENCNQTHLITQAPRR